ncbi:MAG TPA: MarR family transcriptional regulator [Candidatus Dormibacteraeota bacterium]
MTPPPEPRWLDPEEMRAWRGHVRMSWLLAAAIERDLRRSGLSHPDYYVLVRLSEAADHRMRMSDLAEGILWSKSRLSHHIDRMEQRGLVRREDCPSDARGAFACLTPSGLRAIQSAAPAHVESIRVHFLDGLEREQLTTLGDVADIVIARLAPEGAAAQPPAEVTTP